MAAREITGLKFTATGKADAANPAANVQLAGNVAGQPLQGNAVLATTNGKSAINGLLLSLGSSKIAGDLALDQALVPVGTVSLDLPDIGPLAALALEKAEGDVRGTIAFSKAGNGPNVAVKATTAAIKRGDLSAKNVAIDAQITNYLAAPVISGTIKADSVTSGSTVISGIGIDLKRDGDWTNFAGGATASGIPATATGRVKIADGKLLLSLPGGKDREMRPTDLANVLGIEQLNGPVSWLSDRTPEVNRHVPFNSDITYPARMDHNVFGKPLRVGSLS